MTRTVELMSTYVTLMRLDSRVRPHVLDEAAGHHELLAAHVTLVWSFPGVCAHVHHAVPRPLERLGAERTRVRLHAGVRRHVRGQYVGARETSATLVTAERTLPGVCAHVRRQITQRAKHTTTMLTRVLLRCRLRPAPYPLPLSADVVRETGRLGVLLITHEASEHIALDVLRADMIIKKRRQSKAAAAQTADVWLQLITMCTTMCSKQIGSFE